MKVYVLLNTDDEIVNIFDSVEAADETISTDAFFDGWYKVINVYGDIRYENEYLGLMTLKPYELINLSAKSADQNPMSWDELMVWKGNPVWIETPNKKYWTIVLNTGKLADGSKMFMDHEEFYHESDRGKTWEAYKQRRSI